VRDEKTREVGREECIAERGFGVMAITDSLSQQSKAKYKRRRNDVRIDKKFHP
jgi:hypothetical protein